MISAITTMGDVIITASYTHRTYFDACYINESKFIIFKKPTNFQRDLSLDFSHYNVIFLSSFEVSGKLTIKAISVIVLGVLNAAQGKLRIHSEKFIPLGATLIGRAGIRLKGRIFTANLSPAYQEEIHRKFSENNGLRVTDALMDINRILKGSSMDSQNLVQDTLDFFQTPPDQA